MESNSGLRTVNLTILLHSAKTFPEIITLSSDTTKPFKVMFN